MSVDDLQFPQFKSQIIKGLHSRNIRKLEGDLYECKLWGATVAANVPYVSTFYDFSHYLLTDDELEFYNDTSKPADQFARKFQLAVINNAVKERELLIRGNSKKPFTDVAKEILGKNSAYMSDSEVSICTSIMGGSSAYSRKEVDQMFLIQKKYELY